MHNGADFVNLYWLAEQLAQATARFQARWVTVGRPKGIKLKRDGAYSSQIFK